MRRPIKLISFLVCVVAVLWWMLYPDRASSGPYLNSAHGSSSYGVNRTSLSTFGYSIGNCTHCHEMHASVGGAEPAPTAGNPSKYDLFYDLFTDQSTTFCYNCHIGPAAAEQNQISMPNQYNYSRMATGDTSITCPGNIRGAFRHLTNTGNPRANWCSSSNGSAHFLDNIRDFLSLQTWGYGSVDDINPCSGCHNPHRAQYDPHTSSGRIGADGKLVSSVSLPSQHSKDNNIWQLWGDDSTERMSYYAGALTYQAPYAMSNYEPDRSLTMNGLNLVDYVTFCTDCHNNTNSITSTPLGRTLRTINWNTEKHGRGTASDDTFTDMRSPYQDTQCGTYVLACTDCHEPHGARNPFLARQRVNSGTFFYPGGNGDWIDFCRRCHNQLGHSPNGPHVPDMVCTNCHPGGADYRPCTDCHYHGGIF